MTLTDRQLRMFFDAVTNVEAGTALSGKFHWPRVDCFNGSCGDFGAFIAGTVSHLCNWQDIAALSAAFLKYGTDIDDNWMRVAQNAGVDPDVLHEIMLGVFIGGDGTKGWRRARYTLDKAGFNVTKALNVFARTAAKLRVSVSKETS